jgi:hypothetical protein
MDGHRAGVQAGIPAGISGFGLSNLGYTATGKII